MDYPRNDAGLTDMQDNIVKIIETLKAETVGRCRERIDQASKKAKAIIGSQTYEPSVKDRSCDSENREMTAMIKRRHGL